MLGQDHISHYSEYALSFTRSIYNTLIAIVLRKYNAAFLCHCRAVDMQTCAFWQEVSVESSGWPLRPVGLLYFPEKPDVTIIANFYLCSALMAIEQWGFFSVPHLLWHGASVYNYHLQVPVTLTHIAERSAVELSQPVFTILVCRGWDSNTQLSACGANALIHCATAEVKHLDN